MTASAPAPAQNHPESLVTAPPAPNRQRLLVIVLGALIVISAVVVGLLGWQAIGDAHDRSQRSEALNAARTGAPEVLSFDPTDVNTQLAAARKIVSGTFAAQFDQLATAVITPATQQAGLVTKAAVTRAAVIDAQAGQVDVLVFIKQSTSSKTQPQVQSVTNQVKMTMTRSDGGQWLISNMQPL